MAHSVNETEEEEVLLDYEFLEIILVNEVNKLYGTISNMRTGIFYDETLSEAAAKLTQAREQLSLVRSIRKGFV